MATERQIEANRKNSLKTTGPKSTAGKRVARSNALQHGLLAREILLLPRESSEEHGPLTPQFPAEYVPAGACGTLLVEPILHGEWCLRRLPRIDATRELAPCTAP